VRISKDVKEVSRDGLRNISQLRSRGRASEKYRSLSLEARKLVDDNVNQIFWLKNPERWNKKLDPKNPEDKPYQEKWLRIRDEVVMRRDWEKTAVEEKKEQKLRDHDDYKLDRQAADTARLLDKKATEPPKPIEEKFVFKKYGYNEKEYFIKVREFLGENKSPVEAAKKFCVDLNDRELNHLASSSQGRNTLEILFNEMVPGLKDAKVLEQMDRILNVTTGFKETQKKTLEEQIPTAQGKGMEFLGEVKNELYGPYGANPADAAARYSKGLSKEFILKMRGEPNGMRGLLELYGAALGGLDKEEVKTEANRILNGIRGFRDWREPVEEREPLVFSRDLTGKAFLDTVKKEIGEREAMGLDRATAAEQLMKQISDRGLVNASKDSFGRRGLALIYKELTPGLQDKGVRTQADRILIAMGKLSDFTKVDKYIFPVSFTAAHAASITANLTEEGKINVKMNIAVWQDVHGANTFSKPYEEAKTLPDKTFQPEGLTLEPNQWIGFVRHDDGGYLCIRPALSLLELSNENYDKFISRISNIAFAAATPYLRLGGLATKGLSRVIEKTLEVATNVAFMGNIIVDENRGWIIDKWKENDLGRKFVNAWDAASRYAMTYGMLKTMATPLIGKMITSWKEIKSVSGEMTKEDRAIFQQINGKVERMDLLSKEIDKSTRTLETNKLNAKDMTAFSAMLTRHEALRAEIIATLTRTETNPNLANWVVERGVTGKEVEKWILSRPESAQRAFLERMKDMPFEGNVGGQRFCLRDIAHEIRMNKKLREWGISGEHGDFGGTGSKFEKDVAEAMGSTKKKGEDPRVDKAIKTHREGRRHHEPIEADDYIHEALDKLDATMDNLRTKESKFGYSDKVFTPKDAEETFVRLESDPRKAKAMDTVIECIIKDGDPALYRKEYRRWFDRYEAKHPSEKAGTPPRDKPPTTMAPGAATPLPELSYRIETNFTSAQVKDWRANNFWKTPSALLDMRGKEGFRVLVDNRTNQVIAAVSDYAQPVLHDRDGFKKLFEAKQDAVVRPDVEGRGLGKETLRMGVEKAESLGAEYVKFHASNGNSYQWMKRYEPVKSIAYDEGKGGELIFKLDDLKERIARKEPAVETRRMPEERPKTERPSEEVTKKIRIRDIDRKPRGTSQDVGKGDITKVEGVPRQKATLTEEVTSAKEEESLRQKREREIREIQTSISSGQKLGTGKKPVKESGET
jgi:hypothetical protein